MAALLKTVSLLLVFSVLVAASTLYVLPDGEAKQCPTANISRCLTLNGYVKQAELYFLSDTIFMFLTGDHLLRGVADFHDISNVSLMKYVASQEYEVQNPEIVCASNTQSGFLFRNISRLKIESLSLFGCGHSVSAYDISSAAISVSHVTNLSVKHVLVSSSVGRGFYAHNVFGISEISLSNFTHNTRGGNLALDYNNCSYADTENESLVSIVSSFFGHGLAGNGTVLSPGIAAFVWCTNINLTFDDVVAFNNTLHGIHAVGGNMAIIFRNRTHLISNAVSITSCHLEAGSSHYGGGLFLSFELVPSSPVNNSLAQIVTITDTNFVSNHATGEGGGLYVVSHEVVGLIHPVGLVTVTDCFFDSNTLDNRLAAGVALHVNSHSIPDQVEHVQPQYQLNVNSTAFFNSSVLNTDYQTTGSAVFVFHSQSGVHFHDCTFNWNNVTGLSVGKSNVIFSGEVTFEGNVGVNGGGMLLCDCSFLYLTPYTNVSFIGNHAVGTGGGIYVSGLCLEAIPECFFQFSRSVLESKDVSLLFTISVYLVNNTAGLAGSALYGGSVDYCVVMDPWLYTPYAILGQKVFDTVFDIPREEKDYSYLTSDPYEVCLCSDPPLSRPDCSHKLVERTIYPGSTLTVMAAVVGQRHGTVPGAIKAIAERGVSLGSHQDNQGTTVNCTTLNYTVKTSFSQTDIELRVQHSLLSPAPTLKLNRTFVRVYLKTCPIGFTLSGGVCTCTDVIAGKSGIECVLDPYPVIQCSSYSWIGYHNSSDPDKSGIIYHRHCVPGYCARQPLKINTSESSFDQNIQCSHGRAGLLCGGCPPQSSNVFVGQACVVCSSKSVSLLLIIAFVGAGIVVVVVMNVCHLTVSTGEINGLVFYANVLQIMQGSNVPSSGGYIILAWLNLDLGVKTCFYNGMDMFAKVLLQFAFPLYLLSLALLLIFLCRKYQRLASLMGSNSVKVLATLFFLTYTKILRIIFMIFSVSILQYPDGSHEWRWTEDGNMLFARGKHLVLLIFGFAALCFTLPYTIVVTFYPCMQRSRFRCFHWIHRLKPLLDAYGGIYKPRYQFWTGLLLLARLSLLLCFALDVSQDSYYTSLSVLLVCLFVLSLGWVLGGVYQDWRLDVLEASYVLNLAFYSGATLKTTIAQSILLISISVGLAFIAFLLTLIWKFAVPSKVCGRFCAFISRRRDDVSMDVVTDRRCSVSEDHEDGTNNESTALLS